MIKCPLEFIHYVRMRTDRVLWENLKLTKLNKWLPNLIQKLCGIFPVDNRLPVDRQKRVAWIWV